MKGHWGDGSGRHLVCKHVNLSSIHIKQPVIGELERWRQAGFLGLAGHPVSLFGMSELLNQ